MTDPGYYSAGIRATPNIAYEHIPDVTNGDEPVAVATTYIVTHHDLVHCYGPRVRLWRVLAGVLAVIYVLPGVLFTLASPMAVFAFDSGDGLRNQIGFFVLVSIGPCLLVSTFVLGRFAMSGPIELPETMIIMALLPLLPLIPLAAMLIF